MPNTEENKTAEEPKTYSEAYVRLEVTACIENVACLARTGQPMTDYNNKVIEYIMKLKIKQA